MTNYGTAIGTVTGGNYNETTGTLTTNDGELMPVGQVSISDKSISGTLQNNNKHFNCQLTELLQLLSEIWILVKVIY